MNPLSRTTIQPDAADGVLRRAIVLILAVSLIAALFLFWLIYAHPAPDASGLRLAFLPALNAGLNALTAVLLVIGYALIRSGRRSAHRLTMLAAFTSSTLFLLSYILHHALHGDVRYPFGAPLRAFYLALLASHVLLAIVALPLVLLTFFLALSGRFERHRALAHWTLPLWLYVSATGVLTFVLLRLARG